MEDWSQESFTVFHFANYLNTSLGHLIYKLSRKASEKDSLKGKKEVWACNFVSAALPGLKGEHKQGPEKVLEEMPWTNFKCQPSVWILLY